MSISDHTKWPTKWQAIEKVRAVKTIGEGIFPGPTIRQLGSAATDVYRQNLHLLSGEEGSAQRYIDETRPIYQTVVRSELRRMAKVYHETVRQKDSVMAALFELGKGNERMKTRFDVVAAKQLEVEAKRMQVLRTLEDYPMK